jgi:hypothetical protein
LLTALHIANATAVQEFTACTAAAPASVTRNNGRGGFALLDRWPADLQAGISVALQYLRTSPTPSLLYPPTSPNDYIHRKMLDGEQNREIFQSVGASYGWATSLVIAQQMQCAAAFAKSYK